MNETKAVQIKICGLSRNEDIDCVNALLPEYIGFMFFEGSRRHITKDKAAELRKRLDERIKAVGVFVDTGVNEIVDIVKSGLIDTVQLHGQEDEPYIKDLRIRLGSIRPRTKIIKAFKIEAEDHIRKAEQSSADMVMLDSGGGTGRSFDWSLAKGCRRPFILAGGLDQGNVQDALTKSSPFMVDTSSGVETDGVKDPDKVKMFIESVRQRRTK